MQVVVPYVDGMLHPLTKLTVTQETDRRGVPVRFEELSPSNPYAYFELVSELWAACEDFVIVEQDIQLLEGMLAGFQACPFLWCAHPYTIGKHKVEVTALGCTRFKANLMIYHCDALEEASKIGNGGCQWQVFDTKLRQLLLKRGYEEHVHSPRVPHHHIY